jgi:hypothetical protein
VQSPKKHIQEIRVKEDLLPAADKDSMGVIIKAMPSRNKGSLRILFYSGRL